jgi:hypothetical protein
MLDLWEALVGDYLAISSVVVIYRVRDQYVCIVALSQTVTKLRIERCGDVEISECNF